jgi:hypothetical protein
MKIKLLVLVSLVLVGVGCDNNTAAKSFGGTMTVNLEKNQKLVNVTWKDGDTPETYTFKEKSSLGILDGQVILIEH